MSLIPVLLALLPVIVIFLLLVLKKSAADTAGLVGWLVVVAVACLAFRTPLSIALRSSLGGLVASFPISLVVATSIFQVTLLAETGALARVITLIKTVSPENKAVQIMLINIGIGTLLTALGAVPVSILPPIMLALGYSSFAAIALPAIGYDALCTYALLGIPIVVFANFVGRPVAEVGHYFARFMPAISTCIALGMLWLAGKGKLLRKGALPALIAGLTAGFTAIGMNAVGLVTLTGIAAGIAVILTMSVFLLATGRKLIDRSVLTPADLESERKMSLATALSPWMILVVCALLVNAPFLPFLNLTFKKLEMALPIIPGAPEKIRLFWQAYFWILVSSVLAFPFLKPTPAQLRRTAARWWKRAPRPVLAAAIFFAIAFVINHSGKNEAWQLVDPTRNMVHVLAGAAVSAFGRLYVIVAPFLGLLGGFVSGSESSAIAMLTPLHLTAAEKIGAVGFLVAAASGIGGGLASVISPAKLQNAAASIDRIGEEAKVIPATFVIALIITGVCALLSLLWAF